LCTVKGAQVSSRKTKKEEKHQRKKREGRLFAPPLKVTSSFMREFFTKLRQQRGETGESKKKKKVGGKQGISGENRKKRQERKHL